jgi:transposase
MIVCDMDVNTWNYYLRKRILNDCISFSRSFNLTRHLLCQTVCKSSQQMCVRVVPAPRLVCIETNPGPGHPAKSPYKRGQHINDVSKGMILGMKIAGASIKQTAKKLRMSKNTVKQTIHNFEKTGRVAANYKGGRKRKLTQKEEKQMKRKAKKGKSSHQLADEYEGKTGQPISRWTINRVLKKGGLAYMKKKKKEKLTQNHKDKRLAYAKEMKEKKFDWKFVLFSDEKTFYLGTEETKSWQDPENREIVEVSQYVPKINVWGAIGYYFKSDLYFFTDNLNSDLYQQILRARLPPSFFLDCPEAKRGNWIFLQDGAKPHTATETKACLDEIAPDRIPNHPAKSPDLNCIEDIWSHMDREIRKQRNVPNIESLKRRLKKIWNNIPKETIRASVDSMPRRLDACIKLRGERTSY